MPYSCHSQKKYQHSILSLIPQKVYNQPCASGKQQIL